MKIAIIGSRNYPRLARVSRFIKELPNRHEATIITGDANGVDRTAIEAAMSHQVYRLEVYPAQWDRYGRSAGMKRNPLIIQQADMVAAFWDGESKGTAQGIREAKRREIKIRIFE